MAVMRLKKGMTVEVSSKREASLGSWRRAEIMSGNGHTYQVKYESHQPGMAAATERVPRRFIRPLPPLRVDSTNWTPGDIVEAFENHSWKLASVKSVACGDYYSVGIIGSHKQIRAHKSEIRVQQSWKDNHWVIIHQDSGRFACHHHKEHHGLDTGPRKRRRICLPPVDRREIGSADSLEGNDTHSISSSVGSCSPCRNVSLSSSHLTTCPTQDNSLDHDSELHAYHRTMMALYSSEHLTWEKEAFMTDLRIQLHISNDEHLAELKHLTSAQRDRESCA